MRSYRKLLIHADVRGEGGNCQVLDATSMLSINTERASTSVDMACLKKNDISIENEIIAEHNYDITSNFVALSEYIENVVTYMGGYVLKMLNKTVKCEECLELLHASDEEIKSNNYAFIKRRNLGKI